MYFRYLYIVKELAELVQIVAKYRLKKIEVLNNDGVKSGRINSFQKLYKALLSNTVGTDDEANHYIYKKPNSTKFRSFKRRFRARLLNTFLFIDLSQSKYSPYSQAYTTCCRNQYIVRILLMLSSRKFAISIAGKSLRLAIKYELNEFIAYFAKVHKWHAAFTGNVKMFTIYHNMYEKHLAISLLEEKARHYLELLTIHFTRSTSPKPYLLPDIWNNIKALESDMQILYSFDLHVFYYSLKGRALQMEGRYRESLAVWEEMESFLKQNKHIERLVNFVDAGLNKISNYLCLRMYQEIADCVKACEKYIVPHTNNWYILMENYFLAALQSKNAQLAKNILEVVGINGKQYNIPAQFIEKWRFFEAYYLYYLADAAQKKNFRIQKFLNDIYILKKDKQGFNLSLLMFETVYYLREENFGKLINRIESLKLIQRDT